MTRMREAGRSRARAAVVTLYPHQRRVVQRLQSGSSRGLLCIHSTGTGKTLLSAAAVRDLVAAGRISSALVIARKSAVGQFAAEVDRFAPELAAGRRVVVGTHQTIVAAAAAARQPGPYLLVVDEAHEYVNPKGKRFAEVRRLADAARYVLLLTATPIMNSPFDLAVLTSLAKGAPVPDRLSPLAAALERGGAAGEGAGAARPPSVLRDWFSDCVDVHLIDKAADPRFPSLRQHTVWLPMSAATRAEYGRRLRAPAPFYMNLRQLSLGAGQRSEKAEWLTEQARRWVEAGQGKIVVYSAFLDRGARLIRDALVRAGLNVLVIDGKSSASERRRAALMFNRRAEEEPREEMHRDLRALVLSRSRHSRHSRQSRQRGEAAKIAAAAAAKSGPAGACPPPGVLLTRLAEERRAGPGRGKAAAASFRYLRGMVPPSQGGGGDLGRRSPPPPPPAAAPAEAVAYAQSLAIPPPWTPAYVCAPNQKLLWVARDLNGKWQYRYSPDWGDQQEYRKFLRLRAMSGSFWREFEAKVDADLRAGMAAGASSAKVLSAQVAVAARLISQCFFRVGAEGTTSRSKKGKAGGPSATATFGVTSLRRRHLVRCGPAAFRIAFRGKSGQPNQCVVRDRRLAGALAWVLGGGAAAADADRRVFDARVTAAAVRRYLADLRPGLKPKDFRTYAANLELVRHLVAGPDPTKLKPSQRARQLAQGYRAASALLNNTPRMAKEAYVFSGLWVLYQVDPTRFLAAAQQHRGDPAAALDGFVRLFDGNKIDWRYMLRWFRETGGVANFMGPAQVLLITDAGSESIDLAGTRHIVFLDSTWTPAMEDQIVGRGQRFGSHAHLPEAQRRLDVWKLFLTAGPRRGDPGSSVDAYVDALNQGKREQQRRLYAQLAGLSRRATSGSRS